MNWLCYYWCDLSDGVFFVKGQKSKIRSRKICFWWTKVYFMVPHFLFLRKSISGLLKAQNRQNGLVIFISKKWLNVPLKWRHFGFFKLWLCGGQQHFRVIFNWQGLFQLFNSCIWNSSRNFKLKTAKFQNIFRSCHHMCDWMQKLA